jgi:FkbM family methyltransferase
MNAATTVEVETPGGNYARYSCRDGTNDGDIVRAVVGGDEYRLAGRDFRGLVIDVGAHIGSVTIAVALDYPEATVVALEPVPENFAALCLNLQLNQVYARVFPLGRAGGYDGTSRVAYGFPGSHRYIGNEQDDATADVVDEFRSESLSKLLASFGHDEAAFVKIDCEGCEWAFLSDPAIGRVREIAGEVHRGDGPDEFARIVGLLEETHDVQVDRARYLFQAVRR